jgi:nicotinamide-nucleotide adenylyltransferase
MSDRGLPEFVCDLKRLFAFRSVLDRLDPAGPPEAVPLGFSAGAEFGRVGILSGSFNPPTAAHVELAARAASSFRLDLVFLALARVTVDKEEAGGLCPEDRLLLLSEIAARLDRVAVAAVNRGLYFEQAEAFRGLMGRRAKLFVVAGMDKVPQIFDGRYYENRDGALLKLFAEAQLVAAGRGPWEEADLDRLLALPENAPYRGRVYFMAMGERWKELASSKVREEAAAGRFQPGDVPAEVRKFLEATGCYRASSGREGEGVDRYAIRAALLALLYREKPAAGNEDLAGLIEAVARGGSAGEELRALLRSSDSIGSEIALERLSRLRKAARAK